jgi:signal transduction histidine kinase
MSTPVPSAAMGVGYILGCFGGGATFGCMYVVMKRGAAIKIAHELYLANRTNARSTERVEQVEKARGFDRELMMAMTFHEVRNPLNGTVGHLRLAKQLVAGMRRGDVIGGNGVRDAIEFGGQGGGRDGGAGEGGEARGGALGALEEEVDQSVIALNTCCSLVYEYYREQRLHALAKNLDMMI